MAKLLSESSAALLDGLRRWVDPVVAQAGFAWNESGQNVDRAGRLNAVLYEAAPLDFVTRYPESDLQESYDPGEWPPPCVDLWLEFDWNEKRTTLNLEGFHVTEHLAASGLESVATRATRLTDASQDDARMIASALACVLGVSGPGRV
jgi:hypothetical protein